MLPSYVVNSQYRCWEKSLQGVEDRQAIDCALSTRYFDNASAPTHENRKYLHRHSLNFQEEEGQNVDTKITVQATFSV